MAASTENSNKSLEFSHNKNNVLQSPFFNIYLQF